MKKYARKPIHINVPDHVTHPAAYVEAARARILVNAYKTYRAKNPRADEINDFLEENHENEFYGSLLEQLEENGKLSDKQTAIVLKAIDKNAERISAWEAEKKKAHEKDVKNSNHVGTVKKRMDFDLTLIHVSKFEVEDPYNYYRTTSTRYVYNFKDADGNVVVYMGSAELALDICLEGHVNYTKEQQEKYFNLAQQPFDHNESRQVFLKKGGKATIKATVKKHDTYKGVKQTYIQRPVVTAVTTPRGTQFDKNDVINVGTVKTLEEFQRYFDRVQSDRSFINIL